MAHSIIPEPSLSYDIRPRPPSQPRTADDSFQRNNAPAFSSPLRPSPNFHRKEQFSTCSPLPAEGPHGSTKRDACEAFPSSPDSEWCTLPAKKKGKSEAKAVRQDASVSKFRLPLAFPQKPVQIASGAKPKKTLYMPPPPQLAETTSEPNNTRTTPVHKRWKLTRISLQDALEGLGRDFGVDKVVDAKAGESVAFSWSRTRLAITCCLLPC
ncbi:uncharacterized protein PHACADRAFT_254072 [Phanerochaete carnosa HHB-10118-sp]|uniref:Uncharacterized protein n=1 Tax=Phanerochaete carnosa (strain HHB-10118-sp) TaxID=650164 RepID=K5VYV5_PHACS|nr:uncharacterized protein PHACADRAFT_254072 [Phanerochaete carnosa HHB-10118-sp]EKM56763.1 hypothetical protein PHACADRAFT_254072 [Phanerochaete carnosa HHB-10118-sp]